MTRVRKRERELAEDIAAHVDLIYYAGDRPEIAERKVLEHVARRLAEYRKELDHDR